MVRVVITGQGTINALGSDVASTVEAMERGQSGISLMDFPNVDRLNVKIGGQIKDFDPKVYFDRQKITFYDRFTQFALIAAKEAILQSGLVFEGELSQYSGVIFGTAGGGLQTQDENYRAVYEEGKNRVHPFVVPRLMNNAAVSHVSMSNNLKGPSFTVSTACASSNHAMGQAFHLIRSGAAKVMIAGGSESMLCFGGIKAWEGLRVMSQDGCRPFCATRNGMVQGEGAAVFVFEEFEHARARGANILAEISGFAMSSDAGDIVMPSVGGARRAILAALNDAKLNPEDIGYINAHGTSTMADTIELGAVERLLGSKSGNATMSSTKSAIGHLLGAAGAVEAIFSILAIRDQIAPPTLNLHDPVPSVLNLAPLEAVEREINVVLSNSFGFGGTNASLIMGKAI